MTSDLSNKEKMFTPVPGNSRLKVLYILNRGRYARLKGEEEFPVDHFFGYFGLKKLGCHVDLLEHEDLVGIPSLNGLLARLWWPFILWAAAADLAAAFRVIRSGKLRVLNQYDVVIVLGVTTMLALGVLKRLGILRPRVYALVMGVFKADEPKIRHRLYRWLLRPISLWAVSKSELPILINYMGEGADVTYFPWGVDTQFWSPGNNPSSAEGGWVLSIGNDLARDYDTLVAAWKPEYPTLKIVTRLPVSNTKENVELINGHWNDVIFSDLEIRQLFREALFCIIPLKQTVQPSGQSASLQAMGCGKAVIVTKVAGLWDPDNLIDGENCVFVSPGDVDSVQNAVEGLLANPNKRAAIEKEAHRTVERVFNNEKMVQHVASTLGVACQE